MGHDTVGGLEKTKVDEAQMKDLDGPKDGNNADFCDGPNGDNETQFNNSSMVENRQKFLEQHDQNTNQETGKQSPRGEKRTEPPATANDSD
ncbi:hypothetical protein Tco_0342075, partial [Tanacetum coccineum]